MLFRSFTESIRSLAYACLFNNEDLILGLEQTGIRQGPNGFSKDKTGEKHAETEEDKLEHRTDGTDAFDTLWIGMNNFPADYSFNANLISSFM